MHVLILANGEPPPAGLLARLAAECNLFIATDGAGLTAARLGLSPNIVSGDFDSLDSNAAQALLPQTEFVSTPDQNKTDLEKAFEIALVRGAKSITVAGAAGRRIDHTLGNFSLLLRWRAEYPKLPVVFAADGSETRAVSSESVLETEPGDAVSLLSFDGQARVSAGGVRWPLDSRLLAVGVGGLLNEASGDLVTVSADGGVILVCHVKAALRGHG